MARAGTLMQSRPLPLTPDAALQLIIQFGSGLVVWNCLDGTILDVWDSTSAKVHERFAETEWPTPVKSCFFSSTDATVDRVVSTGETLVGMWRRIRAFRVIGQRSTDELVEAIVCERYQEPLDLPCASRYCFDLLYYYHRRPDASQLSRLSEFVVSIAERRVQCFGLAVTRVGGPR